MRMRDIKDMSDLRDLNSSQAMDLLDELRAIAAKRGTELIQQGRIQARRAIGAPDPGAVGGAFIVGVALGAAVGALVAILMAPMPGREARHRLAQQAEQVRGRMPEMRAGGNGRHPYPAPSESQPPMPTGTARPMA